uniref:Uncharacterized protein n=1 Tax=Ovis aries TaxID=9940 RepID=A0AC11EI66_SHEEP
MSGTWGPCANSSQGHRHPPLNTEQRTGSESGRLPHHPAGSVHPPSTSMATSSQYRQLLSDYGPPSLGYTQGTGNSQVPQSKYAELLAIIEELGKEIRPTYAGSKSAMERLKRGIIHARGLVRECLAETERNARS